MTKPLIETNPYLKDDAIRVKLVATSVKTSCGVEGIKVNRNNIIKFKITHRRDKKIYKSAAD